MNTAPTTDILGHDRTWRCIPANYKPRQQNVASEHLEGMVKSWNQKDMIHQNPWLYYVDYVQTMEMADAAVISLQRQDYLIHPQPKQPWKRRLLAWLLKWF
jgi:hypothetical protein